MRGERYFYFSLSKELGMTVREMLSKLDSAELTEWAAYFKIEREDFEKKQKGESDMPLEDKIKMQLKFPGTKVK